MDVYVLNQNLDIIGVLDNYSSLIWRPAYSEIGDFELYLGATREIIDLLSVNNYLVRSIDVNVDEQNKTTYKKVMIIKNIEIITNSDSGNHIVVTGRELKFLLHQRIIWTQTNLSGTAENAIRQLVTENAISPTDNKRVIPRLVLGVNTGLSDSIKKQVTGDYLDDTIIEICNNYDYGWDMYIYDNAINFVVYKGINRSYGQDTNPYVVFSDKFDNLFNTDYQLKTEEIGTTTLIGGEGEGLERIYTTVGNERSGLNRYEVFVDAKDISQNKDTEEEIPLETYLQLLQERGKEQLAERVYTEGFSGEIIDDISFTYGVDYNLGDLVTVINEYGITKNVRVLSAIESLDDKGSKLLPQFNI